MADYYAGVDGGGTKTRAVISLDGKTVCKEAFGEGTNIYSSGKDAAMANLDKLLKELCAELSITYSDISSIGLGMAGINNDADSAVWLSVLRALGIRCPAAAVNDSLAALAGGLHREDGIVLISGTGSICVGSDGKGNIARSGGWDYLIGDEGSAYYIATKIISAVVKEYDGIGNRTVLSRLLFERLGINSAPELIPIVRGYKDKKEKAALAVLLDAACEMGDSIALEIAQDSARELAVLIKSVYEKLGATGELDLITSGGVINGNKFVREAFEGFLRETARNVRPVEALDSPAFGAMLLGRRALEARS